MFKCRACDIEKPLDMFEKDKGMKQGHRNQCKSCRELGAKARYIKDPSKKIANSKRYYENNTELQKSRASTYRLANMEKTRLSSLSWKRNNKGSVNLYSANLKAKKLRATPKWVTPEEESKIKLLYKISAKVSELTGVKMNVDHIIPLQGKTVSGFHCLSNLQIITEYENKSKSNKFEGVAA